MLSARAVPVPCRRGVGVFMMAVFRPFSMFMLAPRIRNF